MADWIEPLQNEGTGETPFALACWSSSPMGEFGVFVMLSDKNPRVNTVSLKDMFLKRPITPVCTPGGRQQPADLKRAIKSREH